MSESQLPRGTGNHNKNGTDSSDNLGNSSRLASNANLIEEPAAEVGATPTQVKEVSKAVISTNLFTSRPPFFSLPTRLVVAHAVRPG